MSRRLREDTRARASGALRETYPDLSNEALREVSESGYEEPTPPVPISEPSSLDQDYAPLDASGIQSQDDDSDGNAAADAAREVKDLAIPDGPQDYEDQDEDGNDTLKPQYLVQNVDEDIPIEQVPLPVPNPNAAMITSQLPKYPWLDMPGATKTLGHQKHPFLNFIHDDIVSIARGNAIETAQRAAATAQGTTATAQGATAAAGGNTTAGVTAHATRNVQTDGAVDFAASPGSQPALDSAGSYLSIATPPTPEGQKGPFSNARSILTNSDDGLMAPRKAENKPKRDGGRSRTPKPRGRQTPSPVLKNKDGTGTAAQPKSLKIQKRNQKDNKAQETNQERKFREKKPQTGLEHDDDSDNFQSFAKFRKVHREGYEFLSKYAACRAGFPLGPDRVAYGQGCLSKESYVAELPYPEAIRTTLWDIKKTKENLTHKMLRELMATRYTRRGGRPSSGQTEGFLAPRGSPGNGITRHGFRGGSTEEGRSGLTTAAKGNSLEPEYNQKASFKQVASTQDASIATSVARPVGIVPDNTGITTSITRPVSRFSYNASIPSTNVPPPGTAPTRPSVDTSKTGTNKQPASSADRPAFDERRYRDFPQKFKVDIWKSHNQEPAGPSTAGQMQRIKCLSALQPGSKDPMWGDRYKDEGEKLHAIHPRLEGPERGPGSSK